MALLTAHPTPPQVTALIPLSPTERAERLRSIGTPIQEEGLTSFVHLGPADSVAVEHFMARFPSIPTMQRLAPDLHSVTVALPHGARVEYKIAASHGHDTESEPDPFNPRRATDPFGANSVAFAPGYEEPWWVAGGDAAAGRLHRGFVESAAFGQRRSLHWYHPAEARGRLPLLIVHDGDDFAEHGGIVTVLDNLIGAGMIPPLVAALIDPGERLVEYTDDARHAEFLREVTDSAIRRQRAVADPARHVYLGASMGAVAALAGAWRNGGVGGLVLLSGSFVTALGGRMQRGALFLPVIDFMERFAAAPGRPAARIYQACGTYEGLAPDNRHFAPLLAATGAAHRFEEVRDGHHWHAWRDRMATALAHTLPGPRALGGSSVGG